MRMRTRTGKTRTTPRGTETVELPRKRSGLLKKANRDDTPLFLDVSLFSSGNVVGSCKDWLDGVILEARLNRSMMCYVACLVAGELRTQPVDARWGGG